MRDVLLFVLFIILAVCLCGCGCRGRASVSDAVQADGGCRCGYACCSSPCTAGPCPNYRPDVTAPDQGRCDTYNHEECDPTPNQTGDMRWFRYHPEVSGVYPVPLLPTTPDQGDPDSARTPVRPAPPPKPKDPPPRIQAHCPSGVC